jgi:tetratricopeptide (TPR) repeat protein
MRLRNVLFFLPLLLVWTACIRSPEVVKKKYLENGNKYFESGKFREASIMYKNAIKKDPRYGEAYYRLGLSELKQNSYATSERALRRAVELMPGNMEANKKLAELFLAFGILSPRYRDRYLDDMRDLAGRLLKRDPRSYEGLRIMGIYALYKGRPKDAIAQFEAAKAVKPLEPDAAIFLVQALQVEGRDDEALNLAHAIADKNKNFLPAYDFLYIANLKKNRATEAEAVLKARLANNPKDLKSYMLLAGFYYGTRRQSEMRQTLESMLSRPGDFPSARMRIGDFYVDIHDAESAIQQFNEGAKADPKNANNYLKRVAEVKITQEKSAEAIQLLDHILKQDPKDSQATAMHASLMLSSDKPEQRRAALNDLQIAVRTNPKNWVMRFYLGRAYLANGNRDQAFLEFQESSKMRSDYLPPLLGMAQIHLNKGEFTKALSILNDVVLKRAPEDLTARLMRSTAMLGVGDVVQARANVMEALKLHPNVSELQLQLAIIDLAEHKYAEAEAGFRKLYESNPADLRSLYALSETYMAQKKSAQAVDLLQKEAQRLPNRLDLQLALGNLAVKAGKYELAVSQYQKVLQKRPDDAVVYLRLGEAYRRTGRIDMALANIRKAVEKAPRDEGPKVQLSIMLDGLGQRNEARQIYQDILKQNPSNAVILNNLAYLMAETGADLDQALSYAQRAKQVMPSSPDVSDTLGWIYIKKNLSDSAIDVFKDLTRRSPERSTFHYHLGMAFYQKGDKYQAKQSLQAALRNKPDKAEESKIRELLAKIG